MNRLAAVLAALLLVLGLAACSDDPSPDEIDSPSQEQEEQTVPRGDGEDGEADPGFEGKDADGVAPVEEEDD